MKKPKMNKMAEIAMQSKAFREHYQNKVEDSTNTPKEEKPLYQRLMEKGYSESKIGQGFVMTWIKPKKE